MNEDRESCRIDVWLWRARFFKTRALAARVVEAEGVRLTRGTARSTLEKAGRQVRVGDVLAFLQGNRRIALRIERLGERRGPAFEARALFFLFDPEAPARRPKAGGDDAGGWAPGQVEDRVQGRSRPDCPDPEG